MSIHTTARPGQGPENPSRLRRAAPSTAAVAAAVLLLAACGTSKSPGVASLGSPSASPSAAAASSGSKGDTALAFSQCMRQHGIASFPDPGTDGGISISGGPGGALDPDSTQFQAAQQSCQSLLPRGAAPDPSQQAAMQQAALAFSQCMRDHGIADFPDPQFGSSGGGFTAQQRLPQGVEARSPQFQAAQQACQSKLPRPVQGQSLSGGPGGSGSGPVTSGGGSGK